MSIGITAWLWLIAAALIPLIIHLWSRKSGQPKILPTFRFLPEKSIARASRIQLHEITLLLLRIALILLIALLLAGLFFDIDQEVANSVKLSESESEYSEEWIGEDVLEIMVPSERIDRLGWWMILEQVEYEYRPDLIITEGRLTADRFTGELPELSADLEWIPFELPGENRQAVWAGVENSRYEYVQRRSELLIESTIAESAEPDESEATAAPFELVIRSDTDPVIKRGFEAAANLWKINISEADLPYGRLANVRLGDREVSLFSDESPGRVQDKLKPGPQFGITIPVTMSDTIQTANSSGRLIDGGQVQVLELKQPNELVLKATPNPAYAHWFYAGVAHQLLKTAAGIDETLAPEVREDQRKPISVEAPVRAGLIRKESATNILLFLILIAWAAERILSNRRGM